MALSDEDRRLVRLFVAIVLGQWERVRSLRLAALAPEPNRAWREAVLQVHLFAGFPRQVEAYEVLAQVGGLGTIEAEEMPGHQDQPEAGRELFGHIYGKNSQMVQDRLHQHHGDFGGWIIGHAYGRVLSRSGLSAARRELLAVGALAATGQVRQLASHARGAIHCGATPEQVSEVLDAIEDLVAAEHLMAAREVASKFSRAKR